MKSIKNRRAEHDYYILQKIEAGIVLTGSEIKSIRAGNVNFRDSYAKIEDGECWLYNLHISPWGKSAHFVPDPNRKRKLLLHKREIIRLKSKVEEQGMTLITLELKINEKGLCKVILALAKGKKIYDKRESLRREAIERDRERG